MSLLKFGAFGVVALCITLSQAVPTASAVDAALVPRNGCSGQGAGHCNLVMGGIPNGDTAITWTEATIYNNACRKLGDQGGLYPVKQANAITSQLKYTVVLELLQEYGDVNYIGMCYAGYCYTGYFACSKDGSNFVTCAHSFPC
ncbi:hypothetical protein B0T12DRAFT_393785 [Alternaria alternata]|nr:hypothetical protein B0T12DRAFT_393785 [Alternaria alternata]